MSIGNRVGIVFCGLVVSSLFLIPAFVHALEPGYTAERLIEAFPDECVNLTNGFPTSTVEDYQKGGIDTNACAAAGGVPKINQAYPWGMAKAGDCLWIGTGANVSILASVAYSLGTGSPSPSIGSTRLQEFGESAFAQAGLVPYPELGDWRPPDIFVYDLSTGGYERKDLDLPGVNDKFTADTTPDEPIDLLWDCQGFRSVGASDTIVFLAGPSLTVLDGGGIVVFAFNAVTKNFIAARRFPEYNNIRKWLFHEGALYTTVGLSGGDGAVLRWVGSVANPFQFEVVGELDNAGAELAVHEGCLFVATWPFSEGFDLENLNVLSILVDILFKPPGLWKSPAIPGGGLTAAQAGGWTKVWNVRNYEPDLITSAASGVGSLASIGGYLVWGTMHPTGAAAAAYSILFPGAEAPFFRVQRATSVYRGRNFNSPDPEIELLYGEPFLPVYNLVSGAWTMERNTMDMDPLLGPSGFGNPFNIYFWNAVVHKEQLYVGTLEVPFGFPPDGFGANFYCFPSINAPARRIEGDGFGESSTSGTRTLVNCPDAMYLGMTNGSNLLYDHPDGQIGGWEVIELIKKPCGEDDERVPNGGVIITDTRRPLFTWCKDPGVASYDLSLYRGGVPYLAVTVDEAYFIPGSDLPEGDYAWDVVPSGPVPFTTEDTASFHIAACADLSVGGINTADPDPASDVVAVTVIQADCPAWTQLWIGKKGKTGAWFKQWYPPALDPIIPSFVFPPPPPPPPTVTHNVHEHDLGKYTVWARLWTTDSGVGPWSASHTYYVGKVDSIIAEGNILCWSNASIAHATWFQIWINDGVGNNVVKKWVRKSNTTPMETDLCYALEGDDALPPGDYIAWIRTWEPQSMGPWSDAYPITVAADP